MSLPATESHKSHGGLSLVSTKKLFKELRCENARVLKFACRLLAECAEPGSPGETGGGG